MGKIQIMTDSASDIPARLERQYGVAVIPFPVTLGGKTYAGRADLDNEGFYALMAQVDEIPKTAQITPFQFQEIYLREAEAGVTDLIMVLINSQGSATYANSLLAVDLFFDEHPEYRDGFHIHSIDGMGYNAMYGAPVVEACKMRDAGAEPGEIVGYLTGVLPRRELYFGIYDLKYAGKSGRIPTAAALLGNALNLKPVMRIFDRAIVTAAKCRGEKRLVEKVAEMSLADMEPGGPYELVYGCEAKDAEEIGALMTEKLGYGPTGAYQIGPAVAANAGPRIVGAAFTKKA